MEKLTAMKTLITSYRLALTILRSQSALILIAFACVALVSAPGAFAVVPAPDGGYPNGNTAEGDNALLQLTTGASNTAIGLDALSSDTIGSNNTATGFAVLLNNTTGFDNTGNGFQALEDNMTGSFNTANGAAALQNNSTGSFNTANGVVALFSNTTGSNNTADGTQALNRNTTGINNTADGFQALLFNTTGFENAAVGSQALFANTTGFHNTADGFEALLSNTTGNHNTADGDIALLHNTSGNFNTASGAHTLLSNTTGSSNIALGVNAGNNLTTGNNNIDIGNGGVAGESDTVRIGAAGIQTRTFIAGVSGVAVAGSAVFVNASGQLGIAASSERFKDEVKPMDKTSEAILALKPVTFHYKKEIDPSGLSQFGLIAEEVEKVNPDLVIRDDKGEIYTVRYDAVNAMLLNEFLKEHKAFVEEQRKVEKLEATVARQHKDFEAALAELKGQIRKVSEQIEASKPAPQVADSNR
jgi:hypothetical protein